MQINYHKKNYNPYYNIYSIIKKLIFIFILVLKMKEVNNQQKSMEEIAKVVCNINKLKIV